MRPSSVVVALSLALVLSFPLHQCCIASDPEPADVVIAEQGRIPVLITAPHGGSIDIPTVPTRQDNPSQRVNLLTDGATDKLAIATAREVERLTGKKPYLIVAGFSRKDLDANRPEHQAFQDRRAKPYYDAYHEPIDRYTRQILDQWGHGLLLDLHAQWRLTSSIMRGTRDGQTCPQLIKRFGWQSVIGTGSVLGRLQRSGYAVYPPSTNESEGEWTHLGSYTVAKYSRLGIDAIQLEIGIQLCGDERSAENLAKFLARGIVDHLDRFSIKKSESETGR